ncbi:MAG: AMP-binding protein [Alphaproteobacteria bacterium]
MAEAWTYGTMAAALARRGSEPAVLIVHEGMIRTVAGARIADEAWRFAAGLRAAGLRPGDRVAIQLPNGLAAIVSRLAVGLVGAVPVPIDDLASETEALGIIRDAACRRVLASMTHAVKLADRLAALPEAERCDVIVTGDGERLQDRLPWWRDMFGAPDELAAPVEADWPAVLVYTSGTTGAPKGFALSYANLRANLDALCATGIVGPGDRVLLPLPLHHVYPVVVGLLTPLMSGGVIVFPETVTGPDIVKALVRAQATIVIGVPRLYSAILEGLDARIAERGPLAAQAFHALLAVSIWARRRFGWALGRHLFKGLHARMGPKLRVLISGGAKLDPEAIERLDALGWDVLSGYGLAETASIFTGNLPHAKRIGSEGRPFGRGEIRIANPGADGVGEIELRGPSIFAGYFNNAEATAAAFTQDGWFRTGDLGVCDADGFLTVTGRAKELIVLGGGKNIYPDDVERVLGESPFVKEVAVLDHRGALVAIVLPDVTALREAGYTATEDALRVDIATRARSLPSYQRVTGLAIARTALPRTRLGKFQRFRLPAIYAELTAGGRTRREAAPPLSPEDQALLADRRAQAIWKLLEEREPALDLDMSPELDLGMDSLRWMAFALQIEEKAGFHMDEAALQRITTVRDLLREAIEAPSVRTVVKRPTEPMTGVAQGPLVAVIRFMVYGVIALVARTYFRLRVEGRENLPPAGPVILAANHVSDLDPGLVAAALPIGMRGRLRWGGDRGRLFRSKAGRWACRMMGIFPVDERRPVGALEAGVAALREGAVLPWFPESWRSPDGMIQRFMPGIGRLLLDAGVPVVPVYIDGAFAAMPRGRAWPRPVPITVRFGPLRRVEDLDSPGPEDEKPGRIADALRLDVVRLV